MRDVIQQLEIKFEITDEDRLQITSRGKRGKFYTRVMWAVSILRKTELLKNTEKGTFKITERGHAALEQKPDKINPKFLSQYDEYIDFVNAPKSTSTETPSDISKQITTDDDKMPPPSEVINEQHKIWNNIIYAELLEKIKEMHPFRFENLIKELLTKMDYGLPEPGQHNQLARDGGIDGMMSSDELGMEKICFQAKRYENNNVGRPDIQRFSGALDGHHVVKGLFITTSDFTEDARIYASNHPSHTIGLISGNDLVKLLYKYNLGVKEYDVLVIKETDQDFFDEVGD